MPASNKPLFVPDRLDWYPGEPAHQRFTIREASSHDTSQVRALLRDAQFKASDKTLTRWLTQHDYSFRLACRNQRHAFAVCVSRTRPTGTHVVVYHVDPRFASLGADDKLLMLAALELPEMPLTIALPPDDARLERLRELGWKMSRTDGDENRYEFQYTFAAYARAG